MSLLGKMLLSRNVFRKVSCFKQGVLLASQYSNDEFDKATLKKANVNIYTIPNSLTALRIISTPFIVYLIIQHEFVSAASLTILSGLTDIADGYIARRFPSQKSVLGSYLDPLADKLFVSMIAFALTYENLFPVSLFVLFIARDVALMSGALYMRYVSQSEPRRLSKLFDVNERVVEMKPLNISKVNTFAQITSVLSGLISPLFGFSNCAALQFVWLLTAGITVSSGVGYARQIPNVYKRALEISRTSKSRKAL